MCVGSRPNSRWNSATYSLYILHGNIYDVFPVLEGAETRFVSLKQFLARRIFPTRAFLLYYDIGDGLTFGAPVTSSFRISGNSPNTQERAYDVLPDGRFVGLIDASEPEGSPASGASEIRVVLNWFEELKARVQPGRP